MPYRNNYIKTNRMDRLSSVLIIFIIAIVSLTGCQSYTKAVKDDLPSTPTNTAKTEIFKTLTIQKRTLEKNKIFHGIFVSAKQENLSFKDVEGYVKAIYVSKGDNVKTGTLLAELDADAMKTEVRQQEIKVQIAKLELEKMKTIKDISPYELKRMELNIELLEIALEKAQKQLRNTKLYAPIDGLVFDVAEVKVGDFILPNKTFITLACDRPSELLLKCKGELATVVEVGQKVTVLLRAPDSLQGKENVEIDLLGLPKKQIKEGIVVMCPKVFPTDAGGDLKDTVYIKVKDLPPGTTIMEGADMKYVYTQRENAIFVRRPYIESINHHDSIYVLKDGVKIRTAVELGVQIGSNVEIVKGLQVGDKIITSEISF